MSSTPARISTSVRKLSKARRADITIIAPDLKCGSRQQAAVRSKNPPFRRLGAAFRVGRDARGPARPLLTSNHSDTRRRYECI